MESSVLLPSLTDIFVGSPRQMVFLEVDLNLLLILIPDFIQGGGGTKTTDADTDFDI